MLLSQCPGQEQAWRSARADPEPCKPLREVCLTFFPFLDDVRTMAARAAVTARSRGERRTKHCRAIMVRSVKDILLDRPQWLAASNTFMLPTEGASSVAVRKRKRRHYGRHQTIRSWHGCRPGHDALLAQGLWTDIDPGSGKRQKASPLQPLQRVRRQAGPLRGGAQTL